METALLITTLMGVTFSFAFGMAWFVPLVSARAEYLASDDIEKGLVKKSVFAVLDILLLLIDTIPIFWIISCFMDAPETMKAGIKRWKEEKMIRVCFWLFVGCVSLSIISWSLR